jgi:hypothetical protein
VNGTAENSGGTVVIVEVREGNVKPSSYVVPPCTEVEVRPSEVMIMVVPPTIEVFPDGKVLVPMTVVPSLTFVIVWPFEVVVIVVSPMIVVLAGKNVLVPMMVVSSSTVVIA